MNAEWLRKQFEIYPDKTKAALAIALGLEAPAISKILNDTRQVKALEYQTMLHFFGLPVDGQHSLTKENSYILTPLDNNYGLSEKDTPVNQDEWMLPASILSPVTNAPQEQIKTFTIRETIMEPEFKMGERVVVDLSDKSPSPPGAFIIFDGFSHILRNCEIIAGSNPPQVKISTSSSDSKAQILDLAKLNAIGRAILKFQYL